MKKYKYIISSLLTVILCFSVLKIEPKASFDYNVKSLSYTHGSVSISSCFGNDVTNFMGSTSTADVYNYLSFTFDKYYTGTVTLKWTYNSSAWRQNLTDWNILVIGGKIDSNNNTSGNIVFRVYDQNSFMVIMTYSASTLLNGTDPTFSFTSATSSLTAVTNHNDLYNNVNDIETELVSANTSLSAMVSMVNAIQGFSQNISTKISNLETYASLESDGITNTDIETKLNLLASWDQLINANVSSIKDQLIDTTTNVSYLQELYTSLTTMNSTLNSIDQWTENIEGEVDGVEELLTAIEGTLIVNGVSTIGTIATNMAALAAALVPSGTETIYDLVSDIVDQFTDPTSGLIAELTSLNTLVNTTNSKLDDVKTTLNNILTAINGIDNQIDTISWNRLNISFLGATTDSVTYDLTQGNYSSSYYFEFDTFTINTYSNDIIHIRVPLYYQDYNNNKFTLSNSTITNNSGYVLLFENRGRYGTDFYFMPSQSAYINSRFINGNVKFRIFTTSTTYLRNTNTSQLSNFAYIETISQNDIEYWDLFQFFDQYNFNKNILNNLLIDINSETGITRYNQDQQEIDTINNNFLTEFNLFKPYVNTTLQPLTSTTFTNEMSNQRTLFDYLFRNLFNLDYNTDDPSTVTNPIFLILIFGGILLALVG